MVTARARASSLVRLPLILERQASGPFLLGGKCKGAMVAFEAARRLMATGNNVRMVAMINPPTVNAVRRPERPSS
nr:thioesterase domain-containing protein [Bradyrhizobium brasilense]